MSATVRDALQLTCIMGVPYFWVDALCIVQDDPIEIKQPYIDNMGSIYTNSAFTIKATDSQDARYGLRGLRELQYPASRTCKQRIVPFGPQQRFIQVPEHDPFFRENSRSAQSVYKYQSRAWIYQESILSRRSLSFLDGMVFWQCDGGWWTEEVIDRKLRGWGRDEGHTLLQILHLPHQMHEPDLYAFGVTVSNYNIKHLTYERDRFDAFAGMAMLLSHAFGQLQSGLPEMFFDVMLLWQPDSPEVRRRNLDGVGQDRNRSLPSWSWAGWQCRIDIGPWVTAGGTQVPPWNNTAWHEVIPFVEWSVSHGLDAQSQHARCKIDPAWHAAKCYSHDATDRIPEGWERHENTDRLPEEERATLYSSWDHPFVYELTANKEKDYTFVCPISVPVLRPDARPEYPPYLHGSLQRAWLTCEARYVQVPDATKAVATSRGCFLLSGDGDRVGWLRMTADTRIDDGITIAQALQRGGRLVELIALSRDVVQRVVPSLEGGRWITRPTGPLEESFNVMWIGWDGGVALRRALGKVQRQAWDGLDRDMVDITLA
ncbi:hypothetical protein VMCG_08169 [Cytospora schulzeri]|uniref:Heterokaryon incompatibility domain-containing protein n=1 Tax=Cytospora schulzeri TaxID=448051 RepID=A0A423VU07_9PEZI|nr:hypothetical protein VMCG_08169 [Valsa malicola]